MIMDISRDWSSGPPAEWHQFVPTIYTFEVDFFHFDLNLYANDQNIIDKMLIKDENSQSDATSMMPSYLTAFVTAIVNLQASRLRSMVKIPLNAYRPEASTISFSIEVPKLTGSVSLPKWNTQSLYNLGKDQRALHIGAFRLQGSYYYLSQIRSGNVDQMKLDIFVSMISFQVHSLSISRRKIVRSKYWGG